MGLFDKKKKYKTCGIRTQKKTVSPCGKKAVSILHTFVTIRDEEKNLHSFGVCADCKSKIEQDKEFLKEELKVINEKYKWTFTRVPAHHRWEFEGLDTGPDSVIKGQIESFFRSQFKREIRMSPSEIDFIRENLVKWFDESIVEMVNKS